MMKLSTPLFVDTEVTIYQNGNPFARRNKLCYVGTRREDGTCTLDNQLGFPDGRREIENSSFLVGFNIKYDLHWLRRAGIAIANKRVWDCQVAHFLLQAQREPYPSLDGTCAHYNIKGKIGSIAEVYWNNGIDTPDIPVDEMKAYLAQDLWCTHEVYKRQVEEFKKQPKLYNLFRMNMDDLLVLEEMEYNGLKLNMDECLKQEQQIRSQIEVIENSLRSRYPNAPINFDSVEHVSVYLYGGCISVDRREVIGIYKSGEKIGQPRYQIIEDKYPLGRLVEPLDNSKLKKDGVWSTAEDVLKELKQIKEVKLLLERARLSKLLDYLTGWPTLVKEKDWADGMVHGQFNQVRARTGRLSSSSPNLQNLPDPMLRLIETRFASQY